MAEAAPTSVFLTLGSNIDPTANLRRAVARLRRELEVEVISGAWESEPWGAPGTPRFLNAAVRVSTGLRPVALRQLLRRIEAELGRRRQRDRNAPRTIDLDIALFGDRVIDEPEAGLRIPDPEIRLRAYLALPLAEVGPEVTHPETGERLADIAARLGEAPDPPRRLEGELGSASLAFP